MLDNVDSLPSRHRLVSNANCTPLSVCVSFDSGYCQVVFPIGPESHVRIGNDSTSALAGSFGTAIFNDQRTFTQLNPSEYLMAYTPGDAPKKVVITKSGSTVASLVLVVSAH